MARESRAAREGLQAVVYRYAVKGPVPDAVTAEVRRAHILRNKVTEVMRDGDTAIAALHAAQPDVAAALETAAAAAARVKEIRDGIQQRKAAGRTRRPDPLLSAELDEARTAAREKRDAAKAVKTVARERLRDAEKAIRDETAAALKALYGQAVSGTLYEGTPAAGAVYWATYNLVASQQQQAMHRVISLRTEGRPAELSFRRWDGEGTIAVQPQRGAGDPARTPAVLADPEAKWRNVILLTPGRSAAEWATLPPCERKRAEIRVRIGSGDSASLETMRVVYHRPVPDNADIVSVQVTVTRVTSTRLRASVALTALLPPPPQRDAGPAAAMHTGWRVLEDGAIRTAVITGATAPPPAAGCVKDAVSARRRHRARLKGERSGVPGRPWAGDMPLAQESGIRDHGDWQEVVIPAGIRDLASHADSLGAVRDREMNGARRAVTAFLNRFPAMREDVDPRGSLGRWRSPGRFRAALAVMQDADPDAAEVRELRSWAAQDTHLELWEAYESRRHVTGWRRDLYRNVAAWLGGSAGVIVTDSWSAARTRPGPGEEDTAQMAAARVNAVLAAPGELRHAVKTAAARRGAELREAPPGLTGVHHGCGGELPADERAAAVHVVCRRCGRRVDQDLNAARAMAASGGVVP